jgi:hypothetical protein
MVEVPTAGSPGYQIRTIGRTALRERVVWPSCRPLIPFEPFDAIDGEAVDRHKVERTI